MAHHRLHLSTEGQRNDTASLSCNAHISGHTRPFPGAPTLSKINRNVSSMSVEWMNEGSGCVLSSKWLFSCSPCWAWLRCTCATAGKRKAEAEIEDVGGRCIMPGHFKACPCCSFRWVPCRKRELVSHTISYHFHLGTDASWLVSIIDRCIWTDTIHKEM